jgi:hypothetical protein
MNAGPGPQAQAGNKPGQMTAVMRAMAVAAGPKVLRIGVVQRGRIVEERVIKQRTTVTVGQNEKNMFIVPAASVPAHFKLFELVGMDYHLNFIDGMTGRVALATGITDIASLKGQAKRVGNQYQVKLTEEARGKIVVGDTTFLFQFVAPPPVQPRPQLPLAVKGGLANQIDWSLTIIAAFSFLLHFGFVGAMYSDWMDPVVSDDINIGQLVDLVKNIPAPPVPDTPEPTTTATATATATAATPQSGGKPTAANGPAGGSRGQVSDNRAAALSAQAEQMQMAMLASLGGGTATQGALNRSDIPPVDLSGAAASGAGVSPGAGDLKFGAGGAPVQGGKGTGLAGIGGGTAAGAGTGAGTERKVEGPKGDAQIGGHSASVPISDADRVIASLRAGFRSCYQQGLGQDPTMSGKVVISAKVGPNGEVSSADVASNTGLSASVASCIARKVRNAQFTGNGQGSTLQIPVTFVQQGGAK